MTELHLVGYTADLDHLVLEVHGHDAGPPYELVVDADLLLTVEELRTRRREHGLDPDLAELERPLVPPRPPPPDPWAGVRPVGWREDRPPPGERPTGSPPGSSARAPASAPGAPAAPAGDAVPPDAPDDDQLPTEARDDRAPEEDAGAPRAAPEARDTPEPAPASRDGSGEGSALSPAQIQAQLRAGRSPRSIAKAAGTDVAWVERWLTPILEERHQALTQARSLKLRRSRLGVSRLALGQAVDRNLSERKVDPTEVSWSSRRRADGTWTVTVRYRSRGRQQSASWRLDRDSASITPLSDLATKLGFVAPTRRSKTAKR